MQKAGELRTGRTSRLWSFGPVSCPFGPPPVQSFPDFGFAWTAQRTGPRARQLSDDEAQRSPPRAVALRWL